MDTIEKWAKELQFISQSALAYCKDIYDIECFERVRDVVTCQNQSVLQ